MIPLVCGEADHCLPASLLPRGFLLSKVDLESLRLHSPIVDFHRNPGAGSAGYHFEKSRRGLPPFPCDQRCISDPSVDSPPQL